MVCRLNHPALYANVLAVPCARPRIGRTYTRRMDDTPLLGMPATRFMRRPWQKAARLIRQALPGFDGVVTRRDLFALAGRDDVESRIVVKGDSARRPRWSLA